ncbi:MAG: peptide deformylase [Actinobacteria bacterium]|nr:peptide deformylase [Actinomycetota bacterium]
MDIVLSPDPRLRTVCEPVDPNDKSIKRIAKQMAKLMYKNNGCGLAAPQVGILKRFVVIDCDVDAEERSPIFLINPEIVDCDDTKVMGDEGCLSVPGVAFPIERFATVTVRATGLEGEEIVLTGGNDLLGRCLQHELDHLDGVTMFERLDPFARIDALRDYQEALARGAKPGDVGGA